MRTARFKGVVIGYAIALVAAFGACANPIAAARNAVTTAAKVQSEGKRDFVAFDKRHQAALVEEAPTQDAALVSLASYRAQRAKVVTLFQSVWLATVAAETAANLAEAGMKDKSDVAGYIAALLQTVGELRDALTALGVPLGGL
jgi:hypothetical protein